MHDDSTDVQGEVDKGEHEVLPEAEVTSGVGSHDEGHKSNPLEGKRTKASHGHGTGESSSGHWAVSSKDNNPCDGERHPGRAHHVDHGLVVLGVSGGESLSKYGCGLNSLSSGDFSSG